MSNTASSHLWTIERILVWTTDFFSSHEIASARLDAEVLLAHALGLSRIDLYIRPKQPLHNDERARYRTLVQKRSQGTPVAYLVGIKEFWSMPLIVNDDVLIPRPETEILVEQVIKRVSSAVDQEPSTTRLVFCDIGTGSGAIALALAKEYPSSTVIATDVSIQALAVARQNIARHANSASGQINLVCTSLSAGIDRARIDVLVANLPYIPRGERSMLHADVLSEPSLALFSGQDGLDLVRELISHHCQVLKPGGILALELASTQVDQVADLLSENGFDNIAPYKDLAGLDRGVIAQRKGLCQAPGPK